MAILTVGAGEAFSTLSAAIAASSDGDVIQVASGTYVNDFATINTKITIEGVGGMVHLLATVAPPDGKAILTINTDVTLYNMEFSGAAVADGNGAGIRYQGGNLVLDHCYFHDNQDGLLAASNPAGSITIANSEFANNGANDGQTHNLYVNEVGTLTITNSYFHDAIGGHEIKSRALNTIVEDSRIAGGTNVNSYEIDLPNGGNATIQNNVIEKGVNAENFNSISFGEEGGVYAGSSLLVTGNTALDDNQHVMTLVHDLTGGTVSITGNQTFGTVQLYSGTGVPVVSGNMVLNTKPAFDTSDPFLPVLPFTFAVCFVEATHILTASGEVAVERLRPGDQVVTVTNGARRLQPVKWIGCRRMDLAKHPHSETVRPIRIVRDAIAANVPRRDLLLSPDHALFLDGVLIVARQLVNDGTIRQDVSAKTIRYFHVELDVHEILLAEGVPSESYLDTGNRGFFANANAPVILHPDLTGKASELRLTGSCAPFRNDEPTVYPIWRRLADRAAKLGFSRPAHGTTNAELRLSVQGQPSQALSVECGCHLFVLPAGVTGVRLRSRAARPTDCRPWLEDRRKLGVSVRGIVLHAGDRRVEIPMDDPALRDGWWAVEHDGAAPRRWTDGNALLPLPPMHAGAVLEIHLAGEMIYPRSGDIGAETARRRRAFG